MMQFICDDRGHCLGFLLGRGKLGIEAFTGTDEISLGLFSTTAAAAQAILEAAKNEAGAG
jgi:hypothetical protein